ncbi:MAG: hypothetical protein HFG15_00640 [Bacilli bacterium]|nr:hypothetical protein [Bacilli bacterium]
MKQLTRYEKFVLIVQSSSLCKAQKIAGDDLLLIGIVHYLNAEYQLYR